MQNRRFESVVTLAILITNFGCSLPSKPKAPSYEIDVEMSLADEVVTMQELIEDREDYLAIQPSGTVGLDIEQDVDRFTVGDNLQLSPPDGNFALPVPESGGVRSDVLGLTLPDEIRVTDAEVRSGSMRFDFSNGSGRSLDIEITLPDFSRQGSVIQEATSVQGGSTASLLVSLNGSDFSPAAPELLRIDARIQSGVGGQDGSVSVVLQPDALLLEEIQGAIRDLPVGFETSSLSVDFPDGEIDVAFSEAAVEIQATSEIGASSELDISVVGVGEGGRSVVLSIPSGQRTLAAGAPGNPAVTLIRFDQTNSNILEFLEIIPRSIQVSGGILIDDGDARVARTDGVDLKLFFRAPLKMVVSESQVLSDPEDIGIDDPEARKRLATNVGAATVTLDLMNHLPLEIGVRLLIGSDREQLETNADLVLPSQGEILLPAAPVDGAGAVQESVTSQTKVELTKEETAVFARFPLFSVVSIRTPGTGGKTVQIEQDDFAQVKMSAKIRILVDERLDD